MAIEGYVDFCEGGEIRGWVIDSDTPDTSLLVEILASDQIVATVRADEFRPDLLDHGKGDGRHAFTCRIPPSAFEAPLSARLPGQEAVFLPKSKMASQPTSAAQPSEPPQGKAQPGAIPQPNTTPSKPALPNSPRFNANFAHTLEQGAPQIEGAFGTAEPTADEPQIVRRLIAAYRRAMDDAARAAGDRKGDMWSDLEQIFHRPIIDLLTKGKVEGVADYLRHAHAQGLTHGITQGETTFEHLRTQPEVGQIHLTLFMDKLASLAEFLGVACVESPEQHGQWSKNLYAPPDELIERISAHIGIPVVPPAAIGSLYGIKTPSGVLHMRDLLALYAALRQQQVARELTVRGPRVCEIGGGLGGTAYYAHRLGVSRYTIIDLPLINVLQGYYLLRSLPDVDIRLYGEKDDVPAAIYVQPTWCFESMDREHDILFNQDSLPEMHPDYALGYLRQAQRNVRHAFLSINQEAHAPQTATSSQTVVRELVQQVGGFRLAYRFRHWLRAGYVEELFRTEQT